MNLTAEQEVARVKQLVSSAKSVLSGQVGITVGVFAISNKLYRLGDEWEKMYPIFRKHESALPMGMPVGTVRLLWNLGLVLESDNELMKVEIKHRAQIMEACSDFIKTNG